MGMPWGLICPRSSEPPLLLQSRPVSRGNQSDLCWGRQTLPPS